MLTSICTVVRRVIVSFDGVSSCDSYDPFYSNRCRAVSLFLLSLHIRIIVVLVVSHSVG